MYLCCWRESKLYQPFLFSVSFYPLLRAPSALQKPSINVVHLSKQWMFTCMCIWRLWKCLCLFVQQLENSVRKELLDKCGQIRLAAEDNEGQKSSLNVELRRSVSVACGASVVELKIKAPTWVGQVDHLTRSLLEYFTLSQRSVIRIMQMTHL